MNKPFLARYSSMANRFRSRFHDDIVEVKPEKLEPAVLLEIIRDLAEVAIKGPVRSDGQEGRAELIRFFEQLARIARQVQQSRGRPRRQDVTEALRLEAAGVSRKEIYRRLEKNTRDSQRSLREAMRQRKLRAGRATK